MDGFIANLAGICDLAEKYDALVMVDDSHAIGFMGASGRGTPEHCGVMGRVDISHRHAGQGLGGGSGGYTTARKEIIELAAAALAAVSFFQHTPAGGCGASLHVLELLEHSRELRTGCSKTRASSARA